LALSFYLDKSIYILLITFHHGLLMTMYKYLLVWPRAVKSA
jgi:hypothetical protein